MAEKSALGGGSVAVPRSCKTCTCMDSSNAVNLQWLHNPTTGTYIVQTSFISMLHVSVNFTHVCVYTNTTVSVSCVGIVPSATWKFHMTVWLTTYPVWVVECLRGSFTEVKLVSQPLLWFSWLLLCFTFTRGISLTTFLTLQRKHQSYYTCTCVYWYTCTVYMLCRYQIMSFLLRAKEHVPNMKWRPSEGTKQLVYTHMYDICMPDAN